MNWYKRILSWWDKIWDIKNKPEPEPKPELEPKPKPEPDSATDIIMLARWDAHAIRWTGKARNWKEDKDSKDGLLSGIAVLEIFRDGKWKGGKFEHCRNNMMDRGWGNVKRIDPEHNQPYGVFKTLRPAVGEPARFRLESYDSKQFTNWIEGVWK